MQKKISTRSSSREKKAQTVGLVKKLVEVLAEVGPIEKKHRNPHFGYNYVSDAQIKAELRGRLAVRGILLTTSVETLDVHYGEAKEGVFASVTTMHTFRDAETGETLSVKGAGVGWDSGDKGVYKAITGAIKETLLHNFLVSDEQDPEAGDQAPAPKPGATSHRRTKAYEEEKAEGNAAATHDLLELKSFLTEHKIPDGFVLQLLRDKKMIDGRVQNVAALNPGILRRLMDKKTMVNLLKAWAAQRADDDSGSATAPAKGPKGVQKEEGERQPFDEPTRTSEGDQTRRSILRKPVQDDIAPADQLEQEGIENWRKVKFHFGPKKGTPLGKLTAKDLLYWVQNYAPKPYKGTWEDKDLLLDAALCLASMEMEGASE